MDDCVRSRQSQQHRLFHFSRSDIVFSLIPSASNLWSHIVSNEIKIEFQSWAIKVTHELLRGMQLAFKASLVKIFSIVGNANNSRWNKTSARMAHSRKKVHQKPRDNTTFIKHIFKYCLVKSYERETEYAKLMNGFQIRDERARIGQIKKPPRWTKKTRWKLTNERANLER